MITILKGDTSPDVSVVLAEGFDYSGATVHVEYQGVRKCFASCKAGDVLTFCFTAEETSPMAFGLHPISVRIVRPNGSIVTVQNSKTAIRVTDDPAEVHADGMIAVDVKGGLFGIQDLPERWTEADLVAKIREILKRGGAIACALFLLLPAFCAEVHTAPKGKIFNDAPVVTNVTFSGLVSSNDVCNIVTNEVSSGWSDWSYTPEIEYFENEEIVSIVPMEWVESGDDPECRFPCWKLQAVTRVQNEVGEVREFESVYYSGYYWESQGYDDAIVVLATDIACDTCIKATRKPLAKNALGLAMAKDVPTAEAVTNVARSVVNSVWDASLGVAWQARMHNGHLYYIAVTNQPTGGK